MEHNNTQETQIALLQQSINAMTATMGRVEVKLDKLDESTRNYVTLETIKTDYVSKESHKTLADKVKTITWGLGVAFAFIVGEIIHVVFQLLGKR